MNNNQKHTIIKERVELYKDFALNLLNYIHKYYIDKETLSEDVDIYNHYSWCYNKVCEEFLEENIDFRKNKELKQYYYEYYYNQFYKIKDGNNRNLTLEYYEKFWKSIFEIDKQKNKNIINLLIEIYIIYDKSINKVKNILELV